MKTTILCIICLMAIAVYAFTPPYNSFTTGQVSPHLEGRTDYPKYNSGCRVLENFIIQAQGPVTKRPGTEYLDKGADTNDTVMRIIPFVYSTDDSYVLEFVDSELRFYRTVSGDAGLIQAP